MYVQRAHQKCQPTTATASHLAQQQQQETCLLFLLLFICVWRAGEWEGQVQGVGYQVLDMPPGSESKGEGSKLRRRWLQNGKYEIYVVPTKYFHVDSSPSMSAIYMQFVCE